MIKEKELDYLEEHIPELAKSAIRQAYWNALASGKSVLESIDGGIYEIFPDGTKKFIKKNEPRKKVTVGQVLELK